MVSWITSNHVSMLVWYYTMELTYYKIQVLMVVNIFNKKITRSICITYNLIVCLCFDLKSPKSVTKDYD